MPNNKHKWPKVIAEGTFGNYHMRVLQYRNGQCWVDTHNWTNMNFYHSYKYNSPAEAMVAFHARSKQYEQGALANAN